MATTLTEKLKLLQDLPWSGSNKRGAIIFRARAWLLFGFMACYFSLVRKDYSLRSAVTGSIAEARRAGM